MIASFWIGNALLMILNVPLIGVWVKLLQVPYRYLFPSAMFLIVVGVFTTQSDLFQTWEVLAFGILGAVFMALDFPMAPILLGVVLGPMMEENFRRALLLSRGDMSMFVTLMGTGTKDIALRFTREADGGMAAVMDALAYVKSVMPQARLLELSPAFNGHGVEATQVVAATLWQLAQPGRSPVMASLDSLRRPTEAVEEICVSNHRYLVGIPARRVTMMGVAKARSIASHGGGNCVGR